MSLPREWSLQDTVERDAVSCAAASQEMVGAGVIDENMNQQNQLGSLMSIHSAPVFELSTGVPSPQRPASLAVQATATSTPIVPPHLQSPETIEDEDNDNLLTISSLTARPLIAKSRELRSTKSSLSKKRRPKLGEIKKPRNTTLVPLDGGYGWVIVCGAFFVQFWVAGLVKSYGVLYVEVMETFKDSSASVASWIPAILSCLCLALGESSPTRAPPPSRQSIRRVSLVLSFPKHREQVNRLRNDALPRPTAPVTSMLCQKYSCRAVVFIGGLFCALGLTISYFATRLLHLFFTFGVLTGTRRIGT